MNEGVSYEFAKALRNFTGGADAAIKVSRHNSRTVGGEVTSQFEFKAVESPVLDRVANALVQDPEPENVTLVGEVTLLSKSTDTNDRLIRLEIESGASVRRARVRLTPEQYALALEAARVDAMLTVSGSLQREGNLFWLYNPGEISVGEPLLREPGAELSDPDAPTLFDEDGRPPLA